MTLEEIILSLAVVGIAYFFAPKKKQQKNHENQDNNADIYNFEIKKEKTSINNKLKNKLVQESITTTLNLKIFFFIAAMFLIIVYSFYKFSTEFPELFR